MSERVTERILNFVGGSSTGPPAPPLVTSPPPLEHLAPHNPGRRTLDFSSQRWRFGRSGSNSVTPATSQRLSTSGPALPPSTSRPGTSPSTLRPSGIFITHTTTNTTTAVTSSSLPELSVTPSTHPDPSLGSAPVGILTTGRGAKKVKTVVLNVEAPEPEVTASDEASPDVTSHASAPASVVESAQQGDAVASLRRLYLAFAAGSALLWAPVLLYWAVLLVAHSITDGAASSGAVHMVNATTGPERFRAGGDCAEESSDVPALAVGCVGLLGQMAVATVPLVLSRVQGTVSDMHLDLGCASFSVGSLFTTVAVPQYPAVAMVLVGLVLTVLCSTPRGVFTAALLFVVMGLSSYNSAVLYDDAWLWLTLPCPHRTPRVAAALYQLVGWVSAAGVLCVLLLFALESFHYVSIMDGASRLVRDAADQMRRYDTAGVRGTIEHYEATGHADPALLASFTALLENLERYRPHLPNWLLVSSSDDDEDGDKDEEEEGEGEGNTCEPSAEASVKSHTARSRSGTMPVPRLNSMSSHQFRASRNPLAVATPSTQSSRDTPSQRRRASRRLGRPVPTKRHSVVSLLRGAHVAPTIAHVAVVSLQLHPLFPTSLLLGFSQAVGDGLRTKTWRRKPLGEASEFTAEAQAQYQQQQLVLKCFSAEMSAAVDLIHTAADESKGAIHSLVGDACYVSWNTGHRAAQPEQRAMRFLARFLPHAATQPAATVHAAVQAVRELRGEAPPGTPTPHNDADTKPAKARVGYLRVSGAATAGRGRWQLAGTRQQHLSVTFPNRVRFEACGAMAARFRAMVVDEPVYRATRVAFEQRGVEAVRIAHPDHRGWTRPHRGPSLGRHPSHLTHPSHPPRPLQEGSVERPKEGTTKEGTTKEGSSAPAVHRLFELVGEKRQADDEEWMYALERAQVRSASDVVTDALAECVAGRLSAGLSLLDSLEQREGGRGVLDAPLVARLKARALRSSLTDVPFETIA